MTVAEAVGLLGGVIFVIRLAPQPWKLWRHKRSDGVSWLGTANAVTASIGWLIYGIATDQIALWVPVVGAVPLEFATLTLLGWRPPNRRSLLICAGWAGVVALSWLLGGTTGLALFIGFGVLPIVVPQVLAAFSTNPEGVAKRTWQIGLADATLWGVYAALTGDTAIILYVVVLGLGSVLILWRLAQVAGRDNGPPLQPVG